MFKGFSIDQKEFMQAVMQTSQQLKYQGVTMEDVSAIYAGWLKAAEKKVPGMAGGTVMDIVGGLTGGLAQVSGGEAMAIAQAQGIKGGATGFYGLSTQEQMKARLQFYTKGMGGNLTEAQAFGVGQRAGLSPQLAMAFRKLWNEAGGIEGIDAFVKQEKGAISPQKDFVAQLKEAAVAINQIADPLKKLGGFMDQISSKVADIWTHIRSWLEKHLLPIFRELKIVFQAILKKFATGEVRRVHKNIGKYDRALRLAIWLGLLLWAITTSWSPWLLFFSGFALFEALFSWCGFYAAIGKKTCPS